MTDSVYDFPDVACYLTGTAGSIPVQILFLIDSDIQKLCQLSYLWIFLTVYTASGQQ